MRESLPEFGPVGAKRWVVADGYIPDGSIGPSPAMTSHESVAMLNAGSICANVQLWVFYADRDPAGPFNLSIEPRRAYHQRLNDLRDPESIPLGTDYCLVVEADTPIVVQHTRLDSRQPENALMSTIAFPVS